MRAPAPAAARGAGRPRGHGGFPGRRSRRSCGRRRRTIATRPTSPRPAATRFDTSSVLDDSPVLLNTALSCAIDSDLRCFGLWWWWLYRYQGCCCLPEWGESSLAMFFYLISSNWFCYLDLCSIGITQMVFILLNILWAWFAMRIANGWYHFYGMNVPKYMDYGAYQFCVLGYTVMPFGSRAG